MLMMRWLAGSCCGRLQLMLMMLAGARDHGVGWLQLMLMMLAGVWDPVLAGSS